MAKTTSQKHAELKKLSTQTRDNIYGMLRLANEILSDHEYVDQFGSEAELIEQMEKNEFSHFGGQPSLGAMLRAYRANPKKATWAEYDYNLRVMIDLAAPAKERTEVERVNWKSRCAELTDRVEELEAMVKEYRTRVEELQSERDDLRETSSELRGQLKLLRPKEFAA